MKSIFLRHFAPAILGLIGVAWAASILLFECHEGQFGCADSSRKWVYGVLLGSALLVVPRLYLGSKLALEFRQYWQESADRQREAQNATKQEMRADLDRLISLMKSAEADLLEPELEITEESTNAEREAAYNDAFRRTTLHFALKAKEDPAHIPAWLMIHQINEKPLELINRGDNVPFVGGLRADNEQSIMRLVADAQSVVLMDMGLEDQIGELVSAPDMVEVIRERGLPVWPVLEGRA